VEVTPFCETTDAHKPPHVLGRVATTILVHVDMPGFHYVHLIFTSSYDSAILMFAGRHLGYCDCPAFAVSFMH